MRKIRLPPLWLGNWDTSRRESTSWWPGIRLLDEYLYFTQGERRLGIYSLLRFVPALARANRILRYRL